MFKKLFDKLKKGETNKAGVTEGEEPKELPQEPKAPLEEAELVEMPSETQTEDRPQEILEKAVMEQEENIEPEESIEEEPPSSRFNLFKRLKDGLSKTKQGITGKIEDLIKSYQKIDEDLFEEIEEILITADLGVETTMEIIDDLKDRVKTEKITEPTAIKGLLKEKLTALLNEFSDNSPLKTEPAPAIILVVGVNGVGKTTSIGKIAHRLKKEGKKVVLAAGDTFRAAAADQLKIWGDRVGVEVIRHQEGADPGAVIYDGIQAAKARQADVLICDTAGRLHNKKNLMNELGKIFKIVEREYSNATKEVLLVLDATTGQNAIQQAKVFKEVADITGLVLTKLDGTAKGGVVVAISRELKIPVKLIGVGEKMEDLQEFDAKDFVEALFGEE
ncbi:signal recognition particle-docking protein FtsY [Alkaliphilus crotonatoxidans]